MADDERSRLESIVSGLDQRNVSKTGTQTYSTEGDGGVKGILSSNYSSFIGDLDSMEVSSYAQARKVVDDYLESVFAAFEPDAYDRIKESLGACDEEERRNYLSQLIGSYMGTPAQLVQDSIQKAQKSMTETGNVGEALDMVDKLLTDPNRGIAQQKAISKVSNELTEIESAEKLINYVADEYLAARGYHIDESQRKLIAADQNKAVEFVNAAVNGSMDPYFRQRYRIQES